MSKTKNIAGVFANKGSTVFRETFQHTSNDVLHYFPGHMAKGNGRKQRTYIVATDRQSAG